MREKSVTTVLDEIIRFANVHKFNNLKSSAIETLIDISSHIPTNAMVSCEHCGELASDEGQERCLFCGSQKIEFYVYGESCRFKIWNDAPVNTIADYVLAICQDPGLTDYQSTKILNIALAWVGYGVRIKKWWWLTKTHGHVLCQAVAIEYLTVANEKVLNDPHLFIDELILGGVTGGIVEVYNVLNKYRMIFEESHK